MSRKYFGTDGVRGRVGEAPITPELIMCLGYAAGKVLVGEMGTQVSARGTGKPGVLIGKDTRISGYLMEAALEAGLSAAGVDVYLSGPLPTPAVAYLTRALRLQAGIVISASHNPYEDNGIKFFSAAGAKLPDSVEQAIEEQMEGRIQCVASQHLGKATRVSDAAGRYIEFCKSTFPTELDLRGLRIVVDCAHGAAYHVAPPVFHELGAEVIAIANEPDGLNINAKVGSTTPANLQAAVLEHQADYGVALDGDGDRLVMVDRAGRIYDGDELMYAIVRHRLAHNLLHGGVVGTLMTNYGLERALAAIDVPFRRASVGDRYVLELLIELGWHIGGENSGHIICLDKHTTGDAIVSALQVLTAVRRDRTTLQELTEELTLYPQQLINVRVKNKNGWEGNPAIRKATEAAVAELGDSGRVLLRASGTEPVLRVMVEARVAEQAKSVAGRLAEAVQGALR
jgi:phosphoglucosamine mutase